MLTIVRGNRLVKELYFLLRSCFPNEETTSCVSNNYDRPVDAV